MSLTNENETATTWTISSQFKSADFQDAADAEG